MTNVSLPKGRSLKDFGDLLDAERIVLRAAAEGELALISRNVPDKRRQANNVRATFVRFLAMGGDELAPIHEKGVRLQGAWIDGDLDLDGCAIKVPLALFACRIPGPISLINAQVATLHLDGSHVRGIAGDRLVASGSIFLRQGFRAVEEVRFLAAQIKGDLQCDGSTFEGKDLDALSCDRAVIQGGLFLRHGFYSRGEVRLHGARIGGPLDCSGAKFENAGGRALSCDNTDVGGSIHLTEGVISNGTIWLLGARVSGNVECSGARIRSQMALVLDGAKVGGSVFFTEGFHSTGHVQLLGTRVEKDVACDGGIFENPNGIALSMDGATIAGGLYLRTRFRALGEVRFPRTKVGGDVECIEASFKDVKLVAFDRAEIGGTLSLRKLQGAITLLSLAGVTAKVLEDDMDSWRVASSLILDGFKYDHIISIDPLDAESRIAWLDRQQDSGLGDHLRPQPWEQLKKIFGNLGQEKDMREIAIAKQKRIRTSNLLHQAYGILYGFGYKPQRLLGYAAVIACLCAIIFYLAAERGVMAPTDRSVLDDPRFRNCRSDAYGNWVKCPQLLYSYTKFNPILYSLDLMVPIFSLSQARDWAPQLVRPCVDVNSLNFCRVSAAAMIAAKQPVTTTLPAYWPLGTVTWIVARLENLFGWIAGFVFVAVASGLVKKD